MTAFAIMFAFTACNDEIDDFADNGNNIENQLAADEDLLEIAISNTGEGMSRATRPMGSSAAGNTVEEIMLKVYSKATTGPEDFTLDQAVNLELATGVTTNLNVANVACTKVSPEMGFKLTFKNNSTEVTNPANGENLSNNIQLKVSGLAENKLYKIVAYGYNPKPSSTFPYGTLSEEKCTFKTTNNALTDYALEEVFAGSVERGTKMVADKGVKFVSAPRVLLTRQVAGMLAYFKVPAFVFDQKVKYVKVYANQEAKDFSFPALTDFNGSNMNTTFDDPNNKLIEIMVFNMENAAKNYNEVTNSDDYYTNGVTSQNDINGKFGLAEGYADIAPADLKIVKDSFFGARYLLPYDKHYTSQTLFVKLLDKDNKVLKTVKVTTAKAPKDGTKYEYDIRCNNFYSIGKKLLTNTTTPDPGTNPDPGTDPDDKPIDLGASDQILVEINDAWSVLHNMDIEE